MSFERIDIDIDPKEYQQIVDAIVRQYNISPASQDYIEEIRGTEEFTEIERALGKAMINEFVIAAVEMEMRRIEIEQKEGK